MFCYNLNGTDSKWTNRGVARISCQAVRVVQLNKKTTLCIDIIFQYVSKTPQNDQILKGASRKPVKFPKDIELFPKFQQKSQGY
jgi:hypothetical protein